MATLAEIQSANEQLIADIAAEKVEVSAKLSGLQSSLSTVEALVVTLQAQIAENGAGVTEAQLDAVLAGIQAAGVAARDIYTADPVVVPVEQI